LGGCSGPRGFEPSGPWQDRQYSTSVRFMWYSLSGMRFERSPLIAKRNPTTTAMNTMNSSVFFTGDVFFPSMEQFYHRQRFT
jgi:hypothetical protein